MIYLISIIGRWGALRMLLEYGANPNSINHDHATPLIVSIYISLQDRVHPSHYSIPFFLIINLISNTTISCLKVASEEGHLTIAKTLLEYGADINAKTTRGATSLFVGKIYIPLSSI